MIEPPVAIRLAKGKTRCQPYLADLQTFYAVTTAAIGAQLGVVAPPGSKSHMILSCRAGLANIALPLNGYVEAAISGEMPEETLVRIEPKEEPFNSRKVGGMESISNRNVTAIFSLFVEPCVDWIKRNRSTDFASWPPVANFCRVVRNAIVHGGTINISSETAPAVSWRHLTYDYRSLGKQILNDGDLSVGDLVLLMLELELELNSLGAPFDLG